MSFWLEKVEPKLIAVAVVILLAIIGHYLAPYFADLVMIAYCVGVLVVFLGIVWMALFR